MPHEQERKILQRYVDAMPAFSPATAKIVQLANQLNASPNDIVAAIRLDPVLTGKVLQLVNSAYFSLAQKITSLNRALVYLGINTIKNLALSTAVMDAFNTKDQALADLIRPTWKHSLATAVCAKSLAKAAHVPTNQVEEYFIAGLLHKLGQIILIQAFHGTHPHDGTFSLEEERARYGLDHSAVGAETLRRWRFADELVRGICSYHAPSADAPLSFYVHVADAMTYRLGLNGRAPDEERPHPVAPEAWHAIGLTEEEVLRELAAAPDQIAQAEIFLNIASSGERVEESL